MNLKMLSEKLGLSQTTVSRALNGYPEVSERTRKRVREAADRHGYRPDSRARSLATGRAMAIGLVIPAASKHEMVNPVFADFVAGAGEEFASQGYDMVVSLVRDEDEASAYQSLATKGRVDGLIVQAALKDDKRIAMLSRLGLPFVVHGRVSEEVEAYSWLDMDNRRAFARATEHLLDHGHRRIALLNGLEAMDFAYRRRQGFEQVHTDRGLETDKSLMRSHEMTESYGFQEASAMLDTAAPPTAFLTSSLLVAMGVRRAVEARGLTIGREVSLVTHDDGLSYLPNGSPDTPIFTATHSSVRNAGHLAARGLLGLISNPDCGPWQTLLEAPLTIGPSSGPVLED